MLAKIPEDHDLSFPNGSSQVLAVAQISLHLYYPILQTKSKVKLGTCKKRLQHVLCPNNILNQESVHKPITAWFKKKNWQFHRPLSRASSIYPLQLRTVLGSNAAVREDSRNFQPTGAQGHGSRRQGVPRLVEDPRSKILASN